MPSLMVTMFRIIPLTVVLYRVMMVCHVEFCYQHGEKYVRDILFRSLAGNKTNQPDVPFKIQHFFSVLFRLDHDAVLRQSEGLPHLQQSGGET